MKNKYPVNIKYTKRSKTVALKVREGEVIVNAPFFTPKSFILNLIEEKKDWISIHVEKQKELQKKDSVFYLGNEYKIQHLDIVGCEIKDDKILVPHKNSQFFIDNFLKNSARNIIMPKINEMIQLTGLEPNKVSFKNTKSQWGSCSRDKNLSFTYRLVSCPLVVIEYVIIHELCHMVEMNHGKAFWNLVFKFCPSYKLHVNWLKKHSFLLT